MARGYQLPLLLLLACGLAVCRGQAGDATSPSTDLFVPVQTVGSQTSGTFRTFYGCSGNGATLSSLTLWANAQFIRGMSVALTDGRQTLMGCVNVTANSGGGCNDTNITSATFAFQAGERVTNLTLWPGYNLQREPNQRAGALTLVTSTGRVFDFGMTDTRISPVSIALGSGIPCGVAPRAGADIDALGFVFLQPVASSVLRDVYYFGLPTSAGSPSLDTAPLASNVSRAVLSAQVYNNSGKTTGLVASFAADQQLDAPASWTTAAALDAYLQPPVLAALPQVAPNASADATAGWGLGEVAARNRSQAGTVRRAWNYTVTVGPGGVSQAVAAVAEASVEATFTANLSLALATGAQLTVPVMGVFDALVTSPVVVSVTELQAPSAKPASGVGSSGGGNTTLAWVLGIVFGLLGALLLTALVLWAAVLLSRRRRRKESGVEGEELPKWLQAIGVSKGKDTGGGDLAMGAKPEGGKPAGWTLPAKQSGPAGTENTAGQTVGRSLMPYAVFRRLRMEALKAAPKQGAGATSEGVAAQQTAEASGELSAPASGASTPRAVPASDAPAAATGAKEGADKAPTSLPAGAAAAPALPAGEAATQPRVWRLKDRVAAVMASRRNAQGRADPASPATEQATAPQQTPAAQPLPAAQSSAAEAASKVPEKPSGLARLLRGVAALVPGGAPPSIKHEDAVISLTGGSSQPATPRAAPVKPPPSPRRPSAVEQEGAALRLGVPYATPADARSVQRNSIDVEHQRVRLGVRYHTQGRNE